MGFAPVVLDDAALRALKIEPNAVVDCIEAALVAHADGRLLTTPKSVIQPGDGRYMMTTLATGGIPGVTVVKAVTVCPDNPARGLPSITGAILVLDAQSGECRAVLDAEWITAMRTAGLSAVAARRLARHDAQKISFVGCGVQAHSHLELFSGLFPLRSIHMLGRGRANMDSLAALAGRLGIEAHICATPNEVLQEADIVVSSIPMTFTGAPFLDASKMKPEALAIVTDAAKPWTLSGRDAFGTVFVDDVQQELSMPDPVIPHNRIEGGLTELVTHGATLRPGPRAFMFRGMALGDHALAAQVWQTVSQRMTD